MEVADVYKFCPVCGAAGFSKKVRTNYLVCSKCNHKIFLNPITSTCVIVKNNNNEILMIKKAEGYRKGCWDIPGGFIDNAENPKDAALRELKEEAGVTGKILELFGVYNNPSYEYEGIARPVVGIVYTAEIIEGTPKAGDDAEEYKWIPLNEVLSYELAYPDIREALEDYIETIKN